MRSVVGVSCDIDQDCTQNEVPRWLKTKKKNLDVFEYNEIKHSSKTSISKVFRVMIIFSATSRMQLAIVENAAAKPFRILSA